LSWWPITATPAFAQGPIKHLDNAAPRCAKGHRGQPAGSCAVCAGDRLAQDDGEEARLVGLDRESARLLARQAAAARRKPASVRSAGGAR
jgi:hypothetical protein